MKYLMMLVMGIILYAQEPHTVKPKPLHKQVPEYPEEARKLRVEGNIYLSALIGTDGSVIETELIKATISYPGVSVTVNAQEELKKVASSHRTAAKKLLATAHNTAKKWKFVPGTVDGKPEESMIIIPFTFSLKNTSQIIPKFRLKK